VGRRQLPPGWRRRRQAAAGGGGKRQAHPFHPWPRQHSRCSMLHGPVGTKPPQEQ
jgi:hypothetical protein